jgi:multicomponent Na+:H+ antiporter subunit E
VTERVSAWVRRALVVAWLAVVWMLLWGHLDVLVGVSALLVAVVAAACSRLPPLPVRTGVRLRRLPGSVLRFLADLFRSSWAVAVTTVRSGPRARASVFALRLPPGTSDVALLLACNRISLEPGTIVLDIERSQDRVYVYQLDTPDRAAAERVREKAQRLFDGVLATFPSKQAAAIDASDDRNGRDGGDR